MSEPLAAVVTVTDLPDGARYHLPIRHLGPVYSLGLIPIALGLGFTGFAAYWIVVAVRDFAWEGDAWLSGLFFLTFMALLGVAGLGTIASSGFLLAGHSEIELRGGTLYAIERWGPMRWTHSRPAAGLCRFVVRPALKPLYSLPFSTGPLADLSVITSETAADVGNGKARPLRLAPGYPRVWLLPLAAPASASTC